MKVYTHTGRKIKKVPSQYDRFIELHIKLGADLKTARTEWKLLTAKITIKSLSLWQ
jgi:hypothetical protein